MIPTLPAAVVFDMDGVLIDSEAAWRQAEDDYLRRIAPGYDPQHHGALIGLRLSDLYALAQKRFGATLDWETFRRHYDTVGEEIYRHRTNLLPGVRSTLKALEACAVPLGLASSSPPAWISATLNRFNLEAFFAAVVSGEDVPNGKPAPDVYLRAAAQLGVVAQNCWAVEDADVGVAAAKAAGMKVFGLRNGANHDQSLDQANVVIGALPDLLDKRFVGRA